MTVNYARHVSVQRSPQSEPIPGSSQRENSAGGYSFVVDDWKRLERFLILGADGGTYYASERKLTQENAQCVLRCALLDARRTVETIASISESGRAPKNDPAIFALALCAAQTPYEVTGGTKPDAPARAMALQALPRVCRTGTHLFSFAGAVNEMRGWGRGLRAAVGEWYRTKSPRDLAYQCVKYQSRNGWSHRDLLRLCHLKADGLTNDVLHWAVKGWPGVGAEPHPQEAMLPIWAFERVKVATTESEIIRLITDYRLVRECIPTGWLNSPGVWEALLEGMPLTALIRNLGKMTAVGLLTPLSKSLTTVVSRLEDADALKRARAHPLALLLALKVYAQGKGEKGSLVWQPAQRIVDALNAAFYRAFKGVEPTGKRWLIAVDCSGSMDAGNIAGMTGMNPRTVAAALALVTAATETNCLVTGFSTGIAPLPISPAQRLDDAIRAMRGFRWGGTDCAQPMLYAMKNRLEVDAFLVITDNETWAGSIHPCQALREYRKQSGVAARSIVMGVTATQFTIADPNDTGMLDVVGCDTAVPQVMADFVRD